MKTYAFDYDIGERVMIVTCTFTDNDGRLVPLKSKRGFIDAIKISAFGDHYLVRYHSKDGEVSEWMNDQQFQKEEVV